MSFEYRIQQWVILDNQQRALADKTKNNDVFDFDADF